MNGILVIDKEKNVTSRDVVNSVCKKLGTKHVGHTGTLDPIATGVLVIGVNEGCKIIELLTSNVKTYEATILVGLKTDTLDITGNVLEEKEIILDKDKVKKVIDNFPLEYMQTVPKYSAVRVNGKRLYEYARNNIEVELPKRLVKIYNIELLEINDNSFKIRTTVSKGTYIRSLIETIGEMLDIPCTMSELRRTKQGIFELSDAYKIDDINENTKLISIKDALKDLDSINVDKEIANKVKNGMILEFNTNSDLLCIIHNDKLIAIYKRYDKDNTKMKPLKVFKEDL